MGNGKFDPLPRPCKPLNRSSQKIAHVIKSWISTDMQNLITIPQWVSFPRMCEIAHQRRLLGFFLGSSNGLNRFSRVIRQTTRFRANMCLFGFRKQKLNIYTRISRKTAILGPILTGLNFRPKTALQWGCSHLNSP